MDTDTAGIHDSELETENSALSPQHSNHNPAEKSATTLSDELAQWERFALKRLARPHSRPFNVTLLPSAIAFDISAELLLAKDKEAIKAVFARARDMLLSA